MYRLSVVTLHDVIPEPEPEPTEGLYTEQEITDMINNDDYIPVATADELDALRDTETQTMGDGTIWEGEYLTGLDKKYVQVDDLDLSSFGNFTPYATEFTGVFDGNELNVNDITISADNSLLGLFTTCSGALKNIKINGSITRTSGASSSRTGLLVGRILADGECIDCHGNGNVTDNTVDNVGGLIGSQTGLVDGCSFTGTVGGTGDRAGGLIGIAGGGSITKNSWVYNATVISGTRSGGFMSEQETASTITENCWVTNTSVGNSSSTISGGFIGSHNGGTIRKCYVVDCIVTGDVAANGFAGRSNGSGELFENCYVLGGSATSDRAIGGFIDINRGTITNCYVATEVNYTTSLRQGGFCAQNSGTITNSYYDTDVSGFSDTGKGLPRTTEQMQQGTADSFILPAGGEDTGEDAANAMYTGWDIEIWEFEPDTEYPELL